jgi:hypothetical protein
MYSNRELSRLAAHKAALRDRISRRRTDCAALTARVVRPVAWLDRARVFWRRLSPFTRLAAVPLGLLVSRAVLPRRGILRTLARWGPLALGAARGLGALLKPGALDRNGD